MAEYSVYFKESIEKDFRSIPQKDLNKILGRIQLLASDPRPFGSQKLTGRDLYRVRQGRYRILYSIQEKEISIWIVKIGHRRDVYR